MSLYEDVKHFYLVQEPYYIMKSLKDGLFIGRYKGEQLDPANKKVFRFVLTGSCILVKESYAVVPKLEKTRFASLKEGLKAWREQI